MAEPMHCYRHPKRETRVSCATCGRPICTECMVATDVGIKCPDDAKLPRGARAGVMKSGQVLKSILAGVAVAVAGIPIAYVLFLLPFTWLISAAAGYGVGTLINRAGGDHGEDHCDQRARIELACEEIRGPLIAMVFAVIAAGVANRQ